MKKVCLYNFLLFILFATLAYASDFSPVVSTDWLEKNLNNPKLVVIDIRKAEDYKANHIPNSINVFYNAWAIEKAGRKNELPEEDDLQDLITNAGINNDSMVVIAGITDNPGETLNMTRVLWTFNYAGFERVAVLDGGYNKWIKEGKALTTDVIKPKPGNFKIKINKKIYADKDYVKNALGKSTIIDARGPDAFFGVTKLDFVARAGHIETAVNLPSAWIFTKDGTFRTKEDLEEMAKGVIGLNKDKEVITYCDSGKFSSGWWFVLSKLLGYKDVKMYDGSAQDWAADPALPMIKYSWK